MKKLLEPIFPIIGYEEISEPFRNIGTAFFINNRGIFVTAAHTFKKKANGSERSYYAVIDNKKVAIKEIFREREEMADQVPPIHKDLYVGRVELDFENNFLNLDTAKIVKDERVLTQGFARRKYVERAPDNGRILDIDELYDYDPPEDDAPYAEDFQFSNEGELLLALTEAVPQTDEEKDLYAIIHSKLYGNYKNSGLEQIFRVSPAGLFNNGFRFSYPLFDGEPKGYSGGPILLDDKVIGMLISKDAAISAAYIAEKLHALNITSGFVTPSNVANN